MLFVFESYIDLDVHQLISASVLVIPTPQFYTNELKSQFLKKLQTNGEDSVYKIFTLLLHKTVRLQLKKVPGENKACF